MSIFDMVANMDFPSNLINFNNMPTIGNLLMNRNNYIMGVDHGNSDNIVGYAISEVKSNGTIDILVNGRFNMIENPIIPYNKKEIKKEVLKTVKVKSKEELIMARLNAI
jgi:hypothetical protein